MRFSPLLLTLAVSSAACVEREGGRERANRARAREFVSRKAPRPGHELVADIEGKVELLGYDAPTTARPGETVEVTWYWHCMGELGAGWKLFTHVDREGGGSSVNADSVGTVREAYPPSAWRVGEYVRDVQRIELPADLRGASAVFYVGLWKGNQRLAVRSGPSDGQNRIRALSLPLRRRAGQAATSLPELRIPRVARPLSIDGKLDEPEWSHAARTELTLLGGRRQGPRTTLWLLWTDDNLFVGWQASDERVHSTLRQHDDPLWTQDVFEVFLDPRGEGRGYYELQVSPAGVVFDSFLPRYRANDNTWSSRMRAAVVVDGTLNEDDDEDRGWSAEMQIPFSSLTTAPEHPPRAGSSYRANFFRLDLGPGDSSPKGSAWSPPERPDFHQTSRFGRIIFVDDE